MSPLLLDPLPARTAFTAHVNKGCLLSHNAREAIRIVAEAGGIADQETFGILQKGLERIWILAPVMPGKNTAVSYHRCREIIIQEIMDQVDPMAHPLVGNAAGKILIK